MVGFSFHALPSDLRLKAREDYTHKWQLQVSSPSYVSDMTQYDIKRLTLFPESSSKYRFIEARCYFGDRPSAFVFVPTYRS